MMWKDGRTCPKCGTLILYSEKTAYYHAKKRNTTCMKCRPTWNKGKKGLQVPWNKGKVGVYSETTIERLRVAAKHSMNESTKKKISLALIGRPAHNRGLPVSDETKRKVRLGVIKTLKERYGESIFPLYNPFACKRIDEYGKQYGYKFQHALNGGEFHIKELGYFVDGYDKNNNVVIEYYEKHHNKPKVKMRDEIRKQEIINHLKCEFIELREE